MVWQSAIFLLAGWLHGITGMGFPLLATSALSFIMPMPKVVALVALPSLLLSLLVLASKGDKGVIQELWHYAKTYRLLALSSVIGSVAGVWLLSVLPVAWLYLLMAAVTLYYAISGLLALFGKAKPICVAPSAKNSVIFGLLAGVVGGATNAMSPLLLMFLFGFTDDKKDIAKASNLCYLLAKLVQIYMLRYQYVLLDKSEYGLIGVLTLLSCVGLFCGIWLRDKISQTLFKTLIFAILLVLALKIGHLGLTTLWQIKF